MDVMRELTDSELESVAGGQAAAAAAAGFNTAVASSASGPATINAISGFFGATGIGSIGAGAFGATAAAD
jgi:hypothetical protein